MPKIEKSSATVRFVGITASAYEMQISGYVQTRDWNEFLAVREEFLLKLLGAIESAGSTLTGAGAPPAPPPPHA